MKKIRVGVVGFGYWGKNQARVFHELKVLEGIYDENLKLLKKPTEPYTFFSTLEELLNRVDAIVICTPANTHYKISLEALKNHKDVLVEKPIAMNLSEVKELIKIEKQNNRIIMVGHQLHFHPAIVKMKELLNKGEIGSLKWIYSNRLNLGKIRPYENVLWSFAPHDISLILEFVKSKVKNIDVQSSKILNNNIEDTTLTLLTFNNLIKAHIFVSWIHPFKEQRFVLVGTEGSMVFSDTEFKNKLTLFKTKINKNGTIESHNSRNIALKTKEPLKEQAKYFLESVSKRSLNINDSIHAYNVVDVLEKSSKLMKSK